MSKKWRMLIGFLLIGLSALMLFKEANYDLHEVKLSMKAMTGQQLTLEEMKTSSIYKAYNQIGYATEQVEINRFLNKKSKNILGNFETWSYPYGYVSIWYKEKPKVLVKVVSFKTPYTAELTEKELYSVFECNSPKEIFSILEEPAILGKTYNDNGEVNDTSYEWGIKTDLSEKFIEDIEKTYEDNVSLPRSYSSPMNLLKWRERKLRLRVSVNADNTIESFSLNDYKDRR